MSKRQDEIIRAYSRENILTLKNRSYRDEVYRIISLLHYNDAKQDITTNAIIKDKEIKALIVSKGEGLLAGVEEISFFLMKNRFKIKLYKNDKELVNKNDGIMEISGSAKRILNLERTLMNILQRMSGISTLTGFMVNQVKKKNMHIKIAGTRKTLLGLLEHKAITLGGGLSHRLGLYDSILIKDNHLAITSISNAIKTAWNKRHKSNFVEIEVKNTIEALTSAKLFKELKSSYSHINYPCIIMLDNFAPDKIKDTINMLKVKDYYNYVLIEVSGGIEKKNILDYCINGVDVISLGFLTHSPEAINFSLEIIKSTA